MPAARIHRPGRSLGSVPNLPEPVLHPSTVRSAVSPPAIVAAAIGAGIGVLAQSVILAVVLGVGFWSVLMMVEAFARARRRRAAQPKPAQLDPWSVPEPWRQLLHQADSAQSRFDDAVKEWPAGPIRERLTDLQPRLWGDVEDIGTIARRGAALSSWTAGVPATGRPSADQLAEQLRQTEAEKQRLAGRSARRDASLARTEEAIAAQIRAVRSAEEARSVVLDRLRVVVARLDETVTSLLVLGAGGGETQAGSVTASLDEINEEITALLHGLAEATSTSSGAVGPLEPLTPLPPSGATTQEHVEAVQPPPAPPTP
jgi:hypothetical protein